jgi:predicted TIM-barrel fold metal-dependent hydrolase
MAVYRKVLSEYSQEDQRKVFHDNAARFYRV